MKKSIFFTLASFLCIITPASADLKDGLLLYFPFDEGKGEIVKDHSGNEHDGKIFNFKQ